MYYRILLSFHYVCFILAKSLEFATQPWPAQAKTYYGALSTLRNEGIVVDSSTFWRRPSSAW